MKKKELRELSTAVNFGHGLKRARKQLKLVKPHTRQFKHQRKWLRSKLKEA